ncbi:capping complex subunit for YIEGIA [Paenibacillus xylaniclasticus]|uniref:capping complex subunit for YIEGIA n=1 Tax=Paenibacillus xylaniclasticus TaxID=588083 RepID=UPI000FD722EC|nr:MULTISPECIES: hypothetical protein [Paenibacillus]GFN30626.1 hypothetical protein PCURB6_08860 [Paenibacillus curdlanolyticus]
MTRILAVVSVKPQQVAGGAPIFIEKDANSVQQTAFLLEKILDANAHDLKNGSIILVDHRSS